GPDLGYAVRALALQQDGKILMNDPYFLNGIPNKGLIRLNADGTKDPSFDPGTGFIYDTNFTGSAANVLVLADGKILVSGNFNIYNGTLVNELIRLNPDGSLDTGFYTPLTSISRFISPVVLPNGKIIVPVRDSLRNDNVVRLNADGDRKSTRLNSSHVKISYAVFC